MQAGAANLEDLRSRNLATLYISSQGGYVQPQFFCGLSGGVSLHSATVSHILTKKVKIIKLFKFIQKDLFDWLWAPLDFRLPQAEQRLSGVTFLKIRNSGEQELVSDKPRYLG